MIGSKNCSERVDFMNFKSWFGFFNNIFLKDMLFILSFFSVFYNKNFTVKDFIIIFTENVSDNKAINFKNYY